MSTPPSEMSSLPDPSDFVDALCVNLSLTQTQNLDLQGAVQVCDFQLFKHKEMTIWCQIGQSTDRASLLLHLITQANLLHLQNSVDRLTAQDTSTAAVLQDFKSKVTDNWAPNDDDKAMVLRAVKDALTDPHRSSFAKAGDDVFKKLENYNKLGHAFKSQKRREVFRTYVREVTNNTKGQLRRKILQTALGDGKKSLLVAVVKLESSLKVSFSDTQRPKFICRVALWRRYARQCSDKSSDDTRPPKHTSSGVEIVESETLQKKTNESFWSGFDKWLEGLRTEYGSDLDSEPWRRYYEETKNIDEQESAVSIAAPVPQSSMSMFRGLTGIIPVPQENPLDPSLSPPPSPSPPERPMSRPIRGLPSRASIPEQRRGLRLDPLSSSPIISSSRAHSTTPYLYGAPFESPADDYTTSVRYAPSNNWGASSSSPFIARSVTPRGYDSTRFFDEDAASRSRAEHRVSRAWEE
ncbi:hypothetical protein VKT23_018014 [Stygiomarasmius scandens]|uniref:Uncharacterized protein n=1 Tax=Marasmiellus scandens TaxID=2682957 RepID=A0ABR1IUL6_9AGAR